MAEAEGRTAVADETDYEKPEEVFDPFNTTRSSEAQSSINNVVSSGIQSLQSSKLRAEEITAEFMLRNQRGFQKNY